MAVHQALLWRQRSEDVVLFTHTGPDPTAEEAEQLAARSIRVVPGAVEALETANDRLESVRLHHGEVVPRRALAVAPRFTTRTAILGALGLESTDLALNGHVIGRQVQSDPAGATQAAGVWIAGNVADVVASVITASAAGVKAAALNADLIAEEIRLAVAARRTGYVPSG
ncbi:putative thioredoxin-disulfide reductase [Frankia sp. Hr75.2]|nr:MULTISPECIES: hypothetical protein [unclassified Parafrankia]CAI7980943.1 putative thioredoxin-disulfide reductase [Frankia sp. Hr75.2]SQD93442.1 putative thioredoxin-disulfide reductase [Parafrankia sp. Ea1.12]